MSLTEQEIIDTWTDIYNLNNNIDQLNATNDTERLNLNIKRINLKNLLDLIEDAQETGVPIPNETQILEDIGTLRIDIKIILNSIDSNLILIRSYEKIVKEKLKLLENNAIFGDNLPPILPYLLSISNLKVSDNVNISGNLDVSYVNISGNLDVSNVNISGNLDVSNVNICGNLDVSNVNIRGNLDVSNVNIFGNLDVSNVNIFGNLDVINVTASKLIGDGFDISNIQINSVNNLQTELNNKEPIINLTNDRVLISSLNKVNVSNITSLQLDSLSGISNNIQNQLNNINNKWKIIGNDINRETGNVGIGIDPLHKLHVNGNIVATGSITANGIIDNLSDIRVKTNIEKIDNALDLLMMLKPVKYDKFNKKESGLIAQDIYYDVKELRHLINISKDASNIEVKSNDYKEWGSNLASLNYIGLIPYLIKGLQEQDKIIKNLEERIKNLEINIIK